MSAGPLCISLWKWTTLCSSLCVNDVTHMWGECVCVWHLLLFLQSATDSECWRSSVESGLTGSPERQGQNSTNGHLYRWVCCPFRAFLAQRYPSRDLPHQCYFNKRFKDPGATFHKNTLDKNFCFTVKLLQLEIFWLKTTEVESLLVTEQHWMKANFKCKVSSISFVLSFCLVART